MPSHDNMPYEDCPDCGGVVMTSLSVDASTARLFEYKSCLSCGWAGLAIELDNSTHARTEKKKEEVEDIFFMDDIDEIDLL